MRALALVCLVAMLVAGCGPRITYRYAGQAYRSQDQALAAARRSHASMVEQIVPATNRVGGTLDVYIPDRNAILDRGIRKTGEPRQEILDYIAESGLLSYQSIYDALVKRNSFDRVALHYSNGEHISPKGGERALYVYQPNVDGIGWFYSSASVPRERVHFDTTKPDRAQRIQYLIDSVEALAKIR
jgi:hypothetical protein